MVAIERAQAFTRFDFPKAHRTVEREKGSLIECHEL
jgi:hypothetical protein